MKLLSMTEVARLPLRDLMAHHQAVDTELMQLLQYKADVYTLIESKRPKIAAKAGAHIMGGKVQ